MLTFSCDSCHATLYFENDQCLACGRKVGFRSDELTMSTTESAAAAGLQPCRNWTEYAACNWFAPARADASGYCVACSLNEVVPDLADAARRALWGDTERAKRRLIFTLLEIGLPLLGLGDKQPLRFRLLADERADTGAVDPPPEKEPIYIGHDNGRLTLNVVEADDVLREAIRKRLNEQYRTMLGHLRHEIGHYYWYLLVDGLPIRQQFRELFGDERADYAAALKHHYETGPPRIGRAYVRQRVRQHAPVGRLFRDVGALHPHRRHARDGERIGARVGRPTRVFPAAARLRAAFASVLADWAPLTVCLNQLTRSMGMRDAYPFAITERVAEKLAFVHDLCRDATVGAAQRPAAATTGAPSTTRQ